MAGHGSLNAGGVGGKDAGRGAAELTPTQVRLLRELADSSRDQGDGVLLDTEVDGVRCLLVRLDQGQASPALSPREREIAAMIAGGRSTREIAGELQISEWTVGTYVRRIYHKLGVSSRGELAVRLVTAGIVPVPPRRDRDGGK